MREIVGNLWDYYKHNGFIVCITTNGDVNSRGEAVMGRGCAFEAKMRVSGLQYTLANRLRDNGNEVSWLTEEILSFPVKHSWRDRADLVLIRKSTLQLMAIAKDDMWKDNVFILPRPGCGNGHLSWSQVRPILQDLPDNVWIISFGERIQDAIPSSSLVAPSPTTSLSA